MKAYEGLGDDLLATKFMHNARIMKLIDDALDDGDEMAFLKLVSLLIVEKKEEEKE